MSTIHVCDRCKAATTNPTVLVLMDIRTVQSEHPGELCEGCLAKLRDWLKGRVMTPDEALTALADALEQCTCDMSPGNWDGPEEDCPLHGRTIFRAHAAVAFLRANHDVTLALLGGTYRIALRLPARDVDLEDL